MAKRIFYVYMHNNSDNADDEVFKVKAKGKHTARDIARSCQQWPGRFNVGTAYTAKECPRDLKWWATDYTDREANDDE